MRDCTDKPILTDDTATIRRAYVSYCQVCGRDFMSPELVYFAPIDNNIICTKCSEIHRDRQLRIYVMEE
jgi:hypothetical protein